jgi:hypothetical protein
MIVESKEEDLKYRTKFKKLEKERTEIFPTFLFAAITKL